MVVAQVGSATVADPQPKLPKRDPWKRWNAGDYVLVKDASCVKGWEQAMVFKSGGKGPCVAQHNFNLFARDVHPVDLFKAPKFIIDTQYLSAKKPKAAIQKKRQINTNTKGGKASKRAKR